MFSKADPRFVSQPWTSTKSSSASIQRLTNGLELFYDTGDFATMYTRLPHDKLKEAIIGLDDHAAQWLCSRYSLDECYLDIRSGTWHTGVLPCNSGRPALISQLDVVIDNTYFNGARHLERLLAYQWVARRPLYSPRCTVPGGNSSTSRPSTAVSICSGMLTT